jgi:CheY-like chemotaxis protein
MPEVQIVGRALCGAEAMQKAPRVSPDLVLADLVMPTMDGLELTRRLKAQPSAPKVILMTQFNGSDCREGALAAGADAYLPKQQVRKLPEIVSELFANPDL